MHSEKQLRSRFLRGVLVLVAGCLIQRCSGDCWTPSVVLQDACKEAVGNTPLRRLLWHGGGAASLDEPDHNLGDNKGYRGDGGTLHDSDFGGATTGEPGTPDYMNINSDRIEQSFFNFVEGRSDRGETAIYGSENGWYKDLFKCLPDDKTRQLCETCGNHCNAFDAENSGYSILNSTELEIENLFWMSKNIYITEKVLLPLSVCVQYDWWICMRRLDENIGVTAGQ